jgi:SNF2 family DNA or RNA helicase
MGWDIDIAEDYHYQVIDEPIDDWYSAIDDSTSYDWFNLELGIILKGEKINLFPILKNILKQYRENNTIMPTEKIYAKLPNGKFIPLPADRIQHILNILIELYDSDHLNEEKYLQLSKLHAARLIELEAAMGAAKLRWFGGKHIRQLGEKLANFKGIEPVSVPNEFQGTLRHYQQDGLNWLQFLREYELGGILADDMGLGKTVQTLCHILVEKLSGRMHLPTLVIAPTSLMFNWQMEAERFTPLLHVLVLHGPLRKNAFENLSQYDLILTTYPLVIRDKTILLKNHFYLLILDEAQFIKNSKNLVTQLGQQIKTKHRLCLTGTPLENHLGELWSLFHFMMPGLLGDEKTFNRLFRTPIEKHHDQDRRRSLNRRIAPFLLRRTKDHVVKDLPDKIEIIRHVELEGAQRDLYETIRITMQKKVQQDIAKLGLSRSHIIILDALLKLRQICCDPRLLKIKTAKQRQSHSAKFELLMSLLTEMIDEGRRILLFSQFTEMLGFIEAELIQQKIPFVKLTGQTKDRATPVQRFQHGDVPLFLISLKAGGTGLNLTAADTVIHYDPWWNPAVENQATDRAHRIGQDKTVFVYKLVAKGTVEEKILEMQQRKRALMEGLFSDTATEKLKLTEHDLQSLFEPLEKDD